MGRVQLLLLGLVCFASTIAAAGPLLRQQHEQELLGAKANPRQAFWQWIAKHQKGYTNDLKEFEHRFRAFVDNLKFIEEYNAKHTTHWLGLNALADLTHEEYKQKYALGYRKFQRTENRLSTFSHGDIDEATLPQEIDWRKKNAVAEVKNQQQCGSCWAFSTTGAVEGINAIVTGELVSLSEQELVDCDTKKDHGCGGGLMDFAFEYITKSKGIHAEDDYPYTATDGVCKRSELNARPVVTIDGYEDVPQYDEVALKKAVSRQPVSVAIEADQRSFQLYMGGVYDSEDCGEQLDHGVLAVGYGVESRPAVDGEEGRHHNYWIIKNSWGGEWGDHGYIKIRMGMGKAGLCGIAMQPSYPIKKGPNPPTPPPGPGPKPGPKPPTPPPSPEPVACDAASECPPATTCCCLTDIAGFCFSWGCCPMEGATCCDDKEHCCPENLPVCDTAEGRCLPKPGVGYAQSVPWSTKLPAQPRGGVTAAVFRGSQKGQQMHSIKPIVS
jgi:KDEL-tailed cysteine endopeptidase